MAFGCRQWLCLRTVLAYDYPLLNLFFTMLWFFLWIIWIMLLFRVIMDIFRDHEMGGFSKVLWLIFVIVLPFLGVFVYVIARGRSMTERDIQRAQANEQMMQQYIRETAGSAGATSGGVADELVKLADLRDRGILSEAEFQAQKSKLMA